MMYLYFEYLCRPIGTLKNAGLFQPKLGQIWTNPNVGLKMYLKMYSWKWKLKLG